MSWSRSLLTAASCLLLAGYAPLAAQGNPGAGTGGILALHQAERMLGHTKRVLMIGAHPDDEDTELLTVLVREQGAEAAYLSLSRGEGGQNLIGPELGEELGLIRTEELLGARALDGARQYFTRAFDFGFSKTLQETERFWPRDSVLKDVVRIVRRFHPQILVAIFSGTPRDGHGQHQMAGWATQEAFKAAGDPQRFPELAKEGLAPWTPLKLYRDIRFIPGSGSAMVELEGGVLDPDIGQSYRQIAMRGRSLHRSQDMGVLQEPGPASIRLALMEDRTGRGAEGQGAGGGLWTGIDTSAAPLGGTGIESGDARRHADDAAAIRAGLVLDATARDGRVTPGQHFPVRLTVWNTGARPAAAELALLVPDGWSVAPCASLRVTVAPGAVVNCDLDVTVPADAPVTTPYFLRAPRNGVYHWEGDPASWGEPFEPPPLRARFVLTPEGGSPLTKVREVVHRYRDQAFGEVRHPILVVPRVDVRLDPAAKLWPTGVRAPQQFTVTLQHGAAERTAGSVSLELPAGWPAVPPQPFVLTREEERETLVFEVRPPGALAEGQYEIRAVARDSAGHRYAEGLSQVDYPHIRIHAWARPALSVLRAAQLTLPVVRRVGYIRGASDRVPEALLGIGLPIDLLDASALERGDLSRYDAIIVGSRAYETEPALLDNNARLLDYARAGGRVLVQYQQGPFFNGGYAPAPLSVAQPHDRVTDENAPPHLLQPEHPAFTRPNRLGPGDWTGWVQERGLYFAHTWDSSYQPLLELSDSGEAPLRGGLLVKQLGKGTYTYTGLSFFRQLPAGVPGAFRLFLNLIDLRATAPQP
ncbi:MAG TPA: NEW3 domain-containing protein [Gemmatimonadales bacterium]|nr:NEW3 domain-containing protein [Gemmatimonadales bacterium]